MAQVIPGEEVLLGNEYVAILAPKEGVIHISSPA
jgi:hypothetical protein